MGDLRIKRTSKLSFTIPRGLLDYPSSLFPFPYQSVLCICNYIGIPQIGCICLVYPS
nr:MAG TPA: hypothetical protein [Caudoviricetes sp.]